MKRILLHPFKTALLLFLLGQSINARAVEYAECSRTSLDDTKTVDLPAYPFASSLRWFAQITFEAVIGVTVEQMVKDALAEREQEHIQASWTETKSCCPVKCSVCRKVKQSIDEFPLIDVYNGNQKRGSARRTVRHLKSVIPNAVFRVNWKQLRTRQNTEIIYNSGYNDLAQEIAEKMYGRQMKERKSRKYRFKSGVDVAIFVGMETQ